MEAGAGSVFLDEEWDSLTRLFSNEEAQGFLSANSDHESAMINVSAAQFDGRFLLGYSNNYYHTNGPRLSSQENISYNDESSFFLLNACENHSRINDDDDNNNNNNNQSMNFYVMDDEIHEHGSLEAAVAAANDDPTQAVQLKRKLEFMAELQHSEEAEEKVNSSSQLSENTNKKSRVSRDTAKKNKKPSGPCRRNQKPPVNDNEEEETGVISNNGVGLLQNGQTQSSSSYSSEEDDSNASDSKGAVNLNGKTRASRGSATDPQSLYARKRRERINERLRILQNLVPNGTKVDISTMLEEAVHYVKFLQLQIKLLSSDEMWMYAPIAYNGMDMGLYKKISPTLL